MINTKKLIPEVYSQSYDMSIFTGLLNLIYNGRDLDNLRLKVSHCPKHCFDEDLTHLAKLFNLPDAATRDTVSNYRLLVKEKGTMEAVQKIIMACSPDLKAVPTLVSSYESETTPPKAKTLKFAIQPKAISTFNYKLFTDLAYKLAPVDVVIEVDPLQLPTVPIPGETGYLYKGSESLQAVDQEGKSYRPLSSSKDSALKIISSEGTLYTAQYSIGEGGRTGYEQDEKIIYEPEREFVATFENNVFYPIYFCVDAPLPIISDAMTPKNISGEHYKYIIGTEDNTQSYLYELDESTHVYRPYKPNSTDEFTFDQKPTSITLSFTDSEPNTNN